MGEFASNGKANAGLTTGIIGTTLGGLWALGAGNGNGGILGGLLGGNNCQMSPVSALQSEVAMLRAEKYSDRSVADLNNATDLKLEKLSDRIFDKYINPMATEIADSRVREAKLQCEVTAMKENYDLKIQLETERLHRRLDNCCCETNGRINDLNTRVYGIGRTLDSITSTIIPQTAICPPVMTRYNSWVAPTDTAPATQPIIGNVDVS